MLSLFLTWKTVWAFCCYFGRFVMESIIVDKIKAFSRLGIDFSYIAFIFIGFNLTQKKPPSSFYVYANDLCKHSPDMDSTKVMIIFLFVVFILWVFGIYLYKIYKKYVSSDTNSAIIKKSLAVSGSCIIGIFLFLCAIITQ